MMGELWRKEEGFKAGSEGGDRSGKADGSWKLVPDVRSCEEERTLAGVGFDKFFGKHIGGERSTAGRVCRGEKIVQVGWLF